MPKKLGIYAIVNVTTQKRYIGSSADIQYRTRKHFEALRSNRHANQYLQRAWNKYGEQCFVVEVVEYIDSPDQLFAREQYWIDTFDATNELRGYNAAPAAGTVQGYRFTEDQKAQLSQTMRTVAQSDEHKNRLRENWRKGFSETSRELLRQQHLGTHHSASTLEKMSAAKRGERSRFAVLTAQQVARIKWALDHGETTRILADQYHVHQETIRGIRRNETWKDVLPSPD